MLGKCSACGLKIIDITVNRTKASLRKLPNYHEHTIELSNGTIMNVAVCDTCKIELVSGKAKKKADEILDKHIQFWDARKKHKDTPRGYQTLKISNPNTDLATFLKKQERERIEIIDIKK